MTIIQYISAAVLVISIVTYYYVQSPPSTTLNAIPVVWSTYRPGLYYGIRASHPHSPLMGLMYYSVGDALQLNFYHHFRHWMEERDNIYTYGTQQHNGDTYGLSTINDTISNINLTAVYIRNDSNNTVISRISGITSTNKIKNTGISLMWYIALDNDQQSFGIMNTSNQFTVNIDTGCDELNNTIQLQIHPHDTNTHPTHSTFTKSKSSKSVHYNKIHYRGLHVSNNDQYHAKEHIQPVLINKFQQLQKQQQQRLQKYYTNKQQQPTPQQLQYESMPSLLPVLSDTMQPHSNLLVVQYIVNVPFTVDIVLHTGGVNHSNNELDDDDNNEVVPYSDVQHTTQLIQQSQSVFHQQFRSIFSSIDSRYQQFAEYLLSSVIGGKGYFYGTSIQAIPDVFNQSHELLHVQSSTALLSTTPCRSFFPRGFLWDEGFHQLIVSRYSLQQSLQIYSSWLNTMNSDGWIPREQILGDESRARVPEQFQPQRDYIANPPTLILTLGRIASRLRTSDVNDIQQHQHDINGFTTFLHTYYNALHRHIQWYFHTQSSHINSNGYTTSVAWRGRTLGHCLASGLDDYPRAEWLCDSSDRIMGIDDIHGCEGHVDLHVWMIALLNTFIVLSEFGQQYDTRHGSLYTKHIDHYITQRDILVSTLVELHWVETNSTYADYTYMKMNSSTNTNDYALHHQIHVGYVSILPMLLGMVQPNSIQLQSIITQLTDPNQLYTTYGIRSLSGADEYYGSAENYWRGNIWINLNYMTVVALKHYTSHISIFSSTGSNNTKQQQSPLSHTAVQYNTNTTNNIKLQHSMDKLYDELRTNLITNIYNNWNRTGFVYEVYDCNDGIGRRSHPFTGWTALTLLMLDESY